MILWGLVTTFLATTSEWIAQAGGVLIAGVILWDIVFRGQIGLSLAFLEEMWSRNLGHLFSSPLRPWELIIALMFISLIRTTIGISGAVFFAALLYKFNIFELGLPLIAFFFCLIVMGWAIGLIISGLLMRFGLGAENLAWLVIFAFAPLSCIYYPLSILPSWLEPIASMVPSAHIFEGMRSVLVDNTFNISLLWHALLLDIIYLAIGIVFFLVMVRSARIRGLIHQMGE
tara:strand:- start:35 stop:724 length:690 start_codon:yes stop_codon:yes gene_type:complete